MLTSLALCALQSVTSVGQAPGFDGLPDSRRGPTSGPARPNIVLIIADDFGVDLMPSYAEGADLPCTPNLDSLTAEGMLFRNAWATPTCTPTRARVLTGRYGFRTGIGSVGGGGGPGSNQGLLLSETTIPEMLTGYATAAVGKWHLAGNQGNTHPNLTGFDTYAGGLGGAVPDYDAWNKVENGTTSATTTYATTDTADEAIDALLSMQEPFFLYASFNAPHSPFHAPDPALCSPGCPVSSCSGVTSGDANWRLGRAMVSAMDTELGRILQVLDTVDPGAIVVFVGDNGTPRQLTRAPFDSDHAKGTVYEGGVNVPLVVRGQGVAAGAECAGLVSVTDLYATFAELAGVPSTAEDSVSLVPYFSDPDLSLRPFVYSETFSPNHQTSLPFTDHDRIVRDDRWKLIRRTGAADELYDLASDPWEATDLFPTMTAGSPAQNAHAALVAELAALGVD